METMNRREFLKVLAGSATLGTSGCKKLLEDLTSTKYQEIEYNKVKYIKVKDFNAIFQYGQVIIPWKGKGTVISIRQEEIGGPSAVMEIDKVTKELNKDTYGNSYMIKEWTPTIREEGPKGYLLTPVKKITKETNPKLYQTLDSLITKQPYKKAK